MPGQVILKTFGNGFPGQYAETPDNITVTRANAGSDTVYFGDPVFAYKGDAAHGSNSGVSPTTASFLGVALAHVKTANAYNPQSLGGYVPNEPMAIMERGSIVVAINDYALNPPVIDGPVYVRVAGGSEGFETGGASPSTDITGLTTPQFKIAVDGGSPSNVTLTVLGCNTGAAVAAQMQTAIRALGGAFAAVDVTFTGGVYVITSGTMGVNSQVRITAGTADDVSAALKIGAANGAVDTQGTGAAAGKAFDAFETVVDPVTSANTIQITNATWGSNADSNGCALLVLKGRNNS